MDSGVAARGAADEDEQVKSEIGTLTKLALQDTTPVVALKALFNNTTVVSNPHLSKEVWAQAVVETHGQSLGGNDEEIKLAEKRAADLEVQLKEARAKADEARAKRAKNEVNHLLSNERVVTTGKAIGMDESQMRSALSTGTYAAGGANDSALLDGFRHSGPAPTDDGSESDDEDEGADEGDIAKAEAKDKADTEAEAEKAKAEDVDKESDLGGMLPDIDDSKPFDVNGFFNLDAIPREKMVPEEGSHEHPATNTLRQSPGPDESGLLTQRPGGKVTLGSVYKTPKKVETPPPPPPSNAYDEAKRKAEDKLPVVEEEDDEAEKKRSFKRPSRFVEANKKRKKDERGTVYENETDMESDSDDEPDDHDLIMNALKESDMSDENRQDIIDRFNKGGSVLVKGCTNLQGLTDEFWRKFYVPGKNDSCPGDKEFRVLKDTPFNPEKGNGNLKGTFIYVGYQEKKKYCDQYIAHLAEPLHVVVAKAIEVMNGDDNVEFGEYLNARGKNGKRLHANLLKVTGNNEEKAPMWCPKVNTGKGGEKKRYSVKCLSPLNKGDSTAKVSYVCPHCTQHFVDFHQRYKIWEYERTRSRAEDIARSAEDDN